jgi:glutamate synthase (NADPH) large chain
VLGPCGRNFAAGMSGGIAFVFDERMDFAAERCNRASVDLEPLLEDEDVKLVRNLILCHAKLTLSRRAQMILDHWSEMQPRFIKVFPHELKRVLGIEATPCVPAMATMELVPQVQHG